MSILDGYKTLLKFDMRLRLSNPSAVLWKAESMGWQFYLGPFQGSDCGCEMLTPVAFFGKPRKGMQMPKLWRHIVILEVFRAQRNLHQVDRIVENFFMSSCQVSTSGEILDKGVVSTRHRMCCCLPV